jgi:hypothetical protein
MFYFAGNVVDQQTGKSKFLLIGRDKNFWRDSNRIRYAPHNGEGLLVKRLKLDLKTIFPVLFTHKGVVKNNGITASSASREYSKKVFLVKFDEEAWITHRHDFYHAGHGLHLIKKENKIIPGDYRKYLVLCSVELLVQPIRFDFVERCYYEYR